MSLDSTHTGKDFIVENKKDLITGTGFFSVGVFLLIQSFLLKGYEGAVAGTDPGIRFLPILTALLLIVVSAFLMVTAIIKLREEKGVLRIDFGTISVMLKKNKKLFMIIAILIGFSFLLKSLGFLLSASVFVFLLLLILSDYKWYSIIIYSLLMTVFSYTVFGYLLKIPLP